MNLDILWKKSGKFIISQIREGYIRFQCFRYLDERLREKLRSNPKMTFYQKLNEAKHSYDGSLVGQSQNPVKLRVNSPIMFQVSNKH